MIFNYRDKFKLSWQELMAEPADQFFTNLYIWGQIQQKKEAEQRFNNGR